MSGRRVLVIGKGAREHALAERLLVSDSVAEVIVAPGNAGTARGSALAPGKVLRNAEGQPLVVGGKTGTGDNRLDNHGPRGELLGSRVLNRTATLVFFIGERHFGTLTAFVPGPQAEGYRFTLTVTDSGRDDDVRLVVTRPVDPLWKLDTGGTLGGGNLHVRVG